MFGPLCRFLPQHGESRLQPGGIVVQAGEQRHSDQNLFAHAEQHAQVVQNPPAARAREPPVGLSMCLMS